MTTAEISQLGSSAKRLRSAKDKIPSPPRQVKLDLPAKVPITAWEENCRKYLIAKEEKKKKD